jgi:hypothetical protein
MYERIVHVGVARACQLTYLSVIAQLFVYIQRLLQRIGHLPLVSQLSLIVEAVQNNIHTHPVID